MAHKTAPSHASLDSRWTAGRTAFARLLMIALAGAAAAGIHAVVIDEAGRRFLHAYLVAFAFVLSISLGGLFFIFIQHLTHAGWSVMVRRFAEALAANMPLVAVLFIPIAASILFGHGELFPWTAHAADGHAGGHGCCSSAARSILRS